MFNGSDPSSYPTTGQYISTIASRVFYMSLGMGLSINGRHSFCGDYIFSGHTVILTLGTVSICTHSIQWLLQCILYNSRITTNNILTIIVYIYLFISYLLLIMFTVNQRKAIIKLVIMKYWVVPWKKIWYIFIVVKGMI